MAVHVGSAVRAPFRGRRRVGVVTELLDGSDIERPLELAAVVGPGLDEDTVDLARWVAGRYLSTVGEALAAALPQRVAGEEDLIAPPVRPRAAERFPFRPYVRGHALERALQEGGGGFVWRPLAAEDRARAIVAMVGEAAQRGGRRSVSRSEPSAAIEAHANAIATGSRCARVRNGSLSEAGERCSRRFSSFG